MNVELIFVLDGGYLPGAPCSKEEAAKVVKAWAETRELIYRSGSEADSKEVRAAKWWLACGTFFSGRTAVAVEHIRGIYYRDVVPSAQERVAAALEKQVGEGEDWKRKGDDE